MEKGSCGEGDEGVMGGNEEGGEVVPAGRGVHFLDKWVSGLVRGQS